MDPVGLHRLAGHRKPVPSPLVPMPLISVGYFISPDGIWSGWSFGVGLPWSGISGDRERATYEFSDYDASLLRLQGRPSRPDED